MFTYGSVVFHGVWLNIIYGSNQSRPKTLRISENKIEITGEIYSAMVLRTIADDFQRSCCQGFAVVCDSVTRGRLGLLES